MRIHITLLIIQLFIFSGLNAPAQATEHNQQQDVLLVEKQAFKMRVFKTQTGFTIKDVEVGWESYGELDEAKNNVILILHHFSGTSHVAGKYDLNDKKVGYWDAIIGPGKAIDTNKFFVISVDSLVNLLANSSNVFTTGPKSINPDTGKPYGLSFPIVTIRDFVEVQKALLEKLGVKKIHAVMGPSMGAMQAIEWGISYPEMVRKVIPVLGELESRDWFVFWFGMCIDQITKDSNWNRGDYYKGKAPIDGLTNAIKMICSIAVTPDTMNRNQRQWAEPSKDPAESFDNRFKVETAMDKAFRDLAEDSDANHCLYLVKVLQLFSAKDRLQNYKAETLLIPSRSDGFILPEDSYMLEAELKKIGIAEVKSVEIKGKKGHLDGLSATIEQVGPEIKEFLEDELSNKIPYSRL